MSKNQATVFGLLLAAALLHILLDPAAKSNFKQFLSISPANWKQLSANTISGYALWFLGLAVMMVVADYAPGLAIWIAILILTSAVLINNGAIVNFLNNTISNMGKQDTGTAPDKIKKS